MSQGPNAPDVGELSPPNRTLMGPGPSDVNPRVLRAMSTPLVGHLDPSFVELMDEVQEL
ncbi:MAG: alanine--glyoxylate aminotransferase family protein, partial [Halolamina sp.]